MHVPQTGDDEFAASVNDSRCLRSVNGRADRGDLGVVNQDGTLWRAASGGDVDYGGVADEEI
jgi:hypothetical protein